MWGISIPHSIPVNQIPFKYYNENHSVAISKLQGLRVTCNPHKFEIPALRFPRKDPVNPCKHLQCSSQFNFSNRYRWVFSTQQLCRNVEFAWAGIRAFQYPFLHYVNKNRQ